MRRVMPWHDPTLINLSNVGPRHGVAVLVMDFAVNGFHFSPPDLLKPMKNRLIQNGISTF
jgi:hypothetical protein